MTTKFELAQQAANTAYAMTLAETNDSALASDAYKAVMAAYMAQAYPPQPRQYIDSARDVTPIKTLADKVCTVYNDWSKFTQAVDSIDGYGMIGDRE